MDYWKVDYLNLWIREMSRVVYHLFQDRQYDKALWIQLQVYYVAIKNLGSSNRLTLASLIGIGRLYQGIGDYVKAEKWYGQALHIFKNNETAKDYYNLRSYSNILTNLGVIYRDLGKYEESMQHYQMAKRYKGLILKIGGEMVDYEDKEEVFRDKEVVYRDYFMTIHNMGIVYQDMGSYSKAQECYQEALDIWEGVPGREQWDYSMTLHNLGGLYLHINDREKAEHYFKKAKEIGSRLHDQKHPTYITSLANLAEFYRYTGNYEKAKSLIQELLELILGDYNNLNLLVKQSPKKILDIIGENYSVFVHVLGSLASIYRSEGGYTEAEYYFKKAKEITRAKVGENHPDYAQELYNLSLVDIVKDRIESAFNQSSRNRTGRAERGKQKLSIKKLLNVFSQARNGINDSYLSDNTTGSCEYNTK
jgi:tetratricopeptide (TPR) repeat protein